VLISFWRQKARSRARESFLAEELSRPRPPRSHSRRPRLAGSSIELLSSMRTASVKPAVFASIAFICPYRTNVGDCLSRDKSCGGMALGAISGCCQSVRTTCSPNAPSARRLHPGSCGMPRTCLQGDFSRVQLAGPRHRFIWRLLCYLLMTNDGMRHARLFQRCDVLLGQLNRQSVNRIFEMRDLRCPDDRRRHRLLL
jgi:hypothetical protein